MPLDLNRPETWTVAVMLAAAVIAFLRGAIIPGVIHDRIVAQLKENHAAQTERLERECSLWQQIALRGVQLSEKSVDVIKEVKKI